MIPLSNLTQREAAAWASRRWGVPALAESHPHPTSIGDTIATLTVIYNGQQFRGIGYSGMAPWGVSMWAKAAHDLIRQEPGAGIGGAS